MNVFKIAGRNGKKSANWYGKVKAGATWERIKLFSDKKASITRLAELQRTTDQRLAGVISVDTERLLLPIVELATQYIRSLRAQKKDPEHIRISEWMLNRMVSVGQWKGFRDITPSAIEAMLPKLAETASYQNKFVVRAKAFVHWALPEGWADPLRKLKRVKEKGAKRTRERRAGSDVEIRALFSVDMPDDRKLAYALAAFNGLRRNEGRDLLGDDLRLDATIPFMGLRQKQGQDDSRDYVPLHPYVLKLLKGRLLMPEAKMLSAVPDMKTMKRDLERAGVKMIDLQGRRLDYHALRHTFQTNLDRTGCSRATKKRLMRHAHEDVTDGYAHAELSEMLSALLRLQSPDALLQTGVHTGTDAAAVAGVAASCETSDHQLDQGTAADGHSPAPTGRQTSFTTDPCPNAAGRYNVAIGMELHAQSLIGSDGLLQVVAGQEFRPSTQVD